MVLILTVLFVAVPIAEIVVILKVSSIIGNEGTILIMILFSAAGAWLVKREGLEAVRRIRNGLKAGRMPTADVVDGFLILAAGVLMMTPGFVTDVCGLLLVCPPVRSAARNLVTRLLRNRLDRNGQSTTFDTSRFGNSGFGAKPTSQTFHTGARTTGQWSTNSDTFGFSTTSDNSRSYQRPGEAWRVGPDPVVVNDDDVIDIDGEEIIFPARIEGPELGPIH